MTKLYQAIADTFLQSIHEGSLRSGDRMPSVRRTAQVWQASITSVMTAYRQLEMEDWIEARPQSGFFVKPRRVAALPLISEPPKVPQLIGNAALINDIMLAAAKPTMVSFGAGCPSPEFFPTAQLTRILGQLMRLAPEQMFAYPLSLGVKNLREALAKHWLDRHCRVHPDEIIITNGGQDALVLALRAVTQPGDVVAVSSPAYFGLLQALENLSLKALECHPPDRHPPPA